MAKFRKKPVVIEAIQWTGKNLDECIDFLGQSFGAHWATNRIEVYTLEGSHIATKGDWLIRGIHGEYYPCKPEIFDKTYEPA